jgi:hypothetical protein
MSDSVPTAEFVPMRRSGRALSDWRRARAVELALAGLSYDAIAEEVGYANRGTAWNVVAEALRRQTVEGVETYRDIELARLDAILAAHWPAAMSGSDLKAADLVTKIIAQRSKLLGIEGAPRAGGGAPRTIVVGASGDYVGELS